MRIINNCSNKDYEISVENNLNEDNTFIIIIENTTLHLSKDEWTQIKTFIDKSIDFIENNK